MTTLLAERQYTDGRYLEKVSDWHTGDSAWKARKVFAMLERNDVRFGSIVDVGCGAGQVLVELQKLVPDSVELEGFDISHQAIGMARPHENASMKFYCDDFRSVETGSRDVMLLLDVFEHVPDYLGFLQNLREKANWIVFHIPLDACASAVLQQSGHMLEMRERFGHLHYFTKETALATLVDVGFEIRDHFFTSDDEIDSARVFGSTMQRVARAIKKRIFVSRPGFAASCFSRFSLMVLARGNRALRKPTAVE